MWSDVLRKLGSLVTSPAGPAVRAAGRVWHLSPEGEALFGSAGPAYDRWLSDGSEIAAITWSPDGAQLAIATQTATYLWRP